MPRVVVTLYGYCHYCLLVRFTTEYSPQHSLPWGQKLRYQDGVQAALDTLGYRGLPSLGRPVLGVPGASGNGKANKP